MSNTAPKEDIVMCRACINECTDYKYLYKQGLILGEVTTLATVLSFCTNLDIIPEEEALPAYICAPCVRRLAKLYVFKKMVLEANDMLRKQQSECIEDAEDMEDHDILEVEQHYVADEVGAEELQELANAAQIKREMEGMEYVTLTVLDESIDGEEEEDNVEGEQQMSEVGEEEEDEDEEIGHIEPDLDGDQELLVDEIEDASEAYSATNEMETYEIISLDETLQPGEDDTTNEHKYKRLVRSRSDTNAADTDEPIAKRAFKTRSTCTFTKPTNPELQCQRCGKQLSNANSLKYHMQLHSENTPFLCSLCGEGFKTRNAYEGHIIIHDPNNPNTCELCGKSYRQSSSLRTHMLSHTGEKPYQCDICGKGMTQKSGYKKHMLIHSGEKPHTCDICGRDFRYSSNLIAHRRCHSEDKPYLCPHCEKSFHTTEQRKRHLVVHTGDKPYACEVCGKRFKRRPSLSAHRNSHNNAHEAQPHIIEQKISKSNVVELY